MLLVFYTMLVAFVAIKMVSTSHVPIAFAHADNAAQCIALGRNRGIPDANILTADFAYLEPARGFHDENRLVSIASPIRRISFVIGRKLSA